MNPTQNLQARIEELENLLNIERITNYFSTLIADKFTEEEVLWDVCSNLISQLGFVDCMIYFWDDDQIKMIQKAGVGPKGSVEEIKNLPFDVVEGQGVVGHVMKTKKAILIPDTRKEPMYRIDEMVRLSEICVPIVFNNKLIGIIDSEHPDLGYFNQSHITILNTIASMMAHKLDTIKRQQEVEQARLAAYMEKQKADSASMNALQSQMNPHFIFNCLNSINNFVLCNESKLASNYLTKFARLMRLTLDNSNQKTISLNQELETLELYVFMERVRFSNGFDFNIDMCMEIDAHSVEVPPLILQPFVENAIWHGLLHKEEKGNVTICLDILEGKWLVVKIEDNGIGREKSQEFKSKTVQKSKSHGLEITAQRLKLLADEENNHIQIEDLYDDGGNAQGTKVTLRIPID
jgi:LytS/YehU family sensor histidine kinase